MKQNAVTSTGEVYSQTGTGERQFLRALKEFTQNAKENPQFGDAAREWERVLAFHIRLRLQQRRRKAAKVASGECRGSSGEGETVRRSIGVSATQQNGVFRETRNTAAETAALPKTATLNN
jgi:hypothetical protein